MAALKFYLVTYDCTILGGQRVSSYVETFSQDGAQFAIKRALRGGVERILVREVDEISDDYLHYDCIGNWVPSKVDQK